MKLIYFKSPATVKTVYIKTRFLNTSEKSEGATMNFQFFTGRKIFRYVTRNLTVMKTRISESDMRLKRSCQLAFQKSGWMLELFLHSKSRTATIFLFFLSSQVTVDKKHGLF